MRPAMKSLWLLSILGIAGAGTPALACSIGSGIPEDDLAEGYRQSSHVFVARLIRYRKVAPPAGGTYMRVEADYELVEAIKGRPAAHGVLFESDPYSPLPGHAPGPACGPWLVHGENVGTLALVMADDDGAVDARHLRVHPFSRRLSAPEQGMDEGLEIILRLHEHSASPKTR